MGVVYRARQLSLNRIVAIKMILAEELLGPIPVERFQAEAESAARLQHPNIVQIYQVGENEGLHYLSMEYVSGPNLEQLTQSKPILPARAARYARVIADAIHYAHQQGILHRDLKPSNILVDASDQPRITDFGLAKLLETDSKLTLSNQALGTPSYMPPEQVSPACGQAGCSSDVYSVGAILYYLLTGQPPFAGSEVADILQRVLQREPVAPRLLNASVPKDLETICLKCLEKSPQRRYLSAQELAEELGRFLRGEPILSRSVSHTEKLCRWCRRRPLVAALAAALLLVLIGGVVGVLWQWRRAAVSETIARHNEAVAREYEMAARRHAYAADMALIQYSLAEGDLGLARTLLNRNRPSTGAIDLRDWEWRYYWQECQPHRAFQRQLLRHMEPIKHLAISTDGKWLAAGDTNGWVGICDLTAGIWRTLQDTGSPFKAVVAFSSGGLLAFTQNDGSGSASIRLWDTAAEKELGFIPETARVLAMVFSPDSRILAASTMQQTVVLWDVRACRVITRFPAYVAEGLVGGPLAISPDGRVLAVGDLNGQIHLLNLPQCDLRRTYQAHDDTITALSFSPDSKTLASGGHGKDPTIRLWDVATGEAIGAPLAGHKQYIHAAAFSPRGGIVASASADQSICLWDVVSRRQLARLTGHEDEVWALAFMPPGNAFVSASRDGSVWLWKAAVEPRPDNSVLLSPEVRRFAYLPDGASFAAVTTSGSAGLWDSATLKKQADLTPLGTSNLGLAASPDGHLLVVGDCSGQVKIWGLREHRVLKSLDLSAELNWLSIRFSRDGRRLLTAGGARSDHCLHRVWDATSWKPIGATWPVEKAMAADISPDGRIVATARSDGAISIWSVDHSSVRDVLRHGGEVFDAAFSPDGSILASGSSAGTLVLWDTTNWQQIGSAIRGRQLAIFGVAFSPDGKRLATSGASNGSAVVVWDVATRRSVAILPPSAACRIPAFSPDGSTIAARSWDFPPETQKPLLYFWRAPSWAEIEKAEISANR
ncbi:MAG: protein kinase [Planctomycetota bacterium]|nr:protein kinase [Planctomycetota bacterium]